MASRREIKCRRCGSPVLVPPQAPAVQCRLCRTVTRLRPAAAPTQPVMNYGGGGSGRLRPTATPTEPIMNCGGGGAGRLRPAASPTEPIMNYGGGGGGAGRLRPAFDPTQPITSYGDGGCGRLRPTTEPTQPAMNYGGGAGRLRPTTDPIEPVMNYGGGAGRLRPTTDPTEPVMNYGSGGGRPRPATNDTTEPIMNYGGGAGTLRPTAEHTQPAMNYGGGAATLRPTTEPTQPAMNYNDGAGRLRPTADPTEHTFSYGGGGRPAPVAPEPVIINNGGGGGGGAGRVRPTTTAPTQHTMNHGGAGGGRFGVRFNSNNEAATVPTPANYHSNPTSPAAMSPNSQNNRYAFARPVAQVQPAMVVPPPTQGRRRALLCGVSYYGRKYEVKGSLNDVKAMRSLLINKLGFPSDSVLTLSEEEANPLKIPTKQNMRKALKWLIQGCQAGDSLVFHYSGHGSRQKDYNGDEKDGYDEALCPTDYETEGMIIDDEVNATIVRPLPKGAKLHAIMDTCYSGTVLDLPYLCRMNKEGYFGWEDQRLPSAAYKGTSGGLVMCFSACDDNETSSDTSAFSDTMTGAMTYSFVQALTKEPGLTYGSLLNSMRCTIRDAKKDQMEGQMQINIAQEPQLSASQQFNIYKNKFLL